MSNPAADEAAGVSLPASAAVDQDNIELIDGIGPKVAEKLRAKGITTFEQIAQLTEDELDRLNDELKLKGAPQRTDWRTQAEEFYAAKSGAQPLPHLPMDDVPPPVQVPSPETVSIAVDPATLEVVRLKRRRLNRNKAFSDVLGQYHGATHSQIIGDQRVYFGQDDIEVGSEPKDGGAFTPAQAEEAEPEHPITAETLDLGLWMGGVNYDLPIVFGAIMLRYGKHVRAEHDAVEFLKAVGMRNRR